MTFDFSKKLFVSTIAEDCAAAAREHSLGLEIAESSGHFHEKIINTETMPPSFWNWFVIGFERSEGNDDKILNYTRIFEANKRKLLRMSEGKHVINAFRKTGI